MKKSLLISAFVAATLSPMVANSALLFSFQEVGGNVTMTSSGTLDTNKLVVGNTNSWGGTGIEENSNHDIMGGTSFGAINQSYGFNAGTDYSEWASANGPWTSDDFNWTVTGGTKSFTTYIRETGNDAQLPGFGLRTEDLVNGIWTTDQNWTNFGASFASLGMIAGLYTVTDFITSESIAFQIGGQSAVPVPAALFLFAPALLGFLGLRRKATTVA